MNRFSERLKYLRRRKGITQMELGRFLGYRDTTISNYENAVHQPDYDTLIQIAEYFDVSIDFLIGFEEENPDYSLEEMELLQRYRRMSLERQKIIFRLIELLGEKTGKPNTHK